MNASVYLKSYGWKEGEALQEGGLRKPILVKHKKDTKGLGHGTNDADMWWEKLFDGQLKSMEVSSSSSGVTISRNEAKVEDHMRKETSALYRMFVKGVGLQGTVGKTSHTKTTDHIDRDEVANAIDKAFGTIVNKDKKDKKDSKSKEKKEKKEKRVKDSKVKKEETKSKKSSKNEDKLGKKEKKDTTSKSKDKKDKSENIVKVKSIKKKSSSKELSNKKTKDTKISDKKSKKRKSDDTTDSTDSSKKRKRS
ncbi:uncharacterized protein RJT20DRAFT_123985 [Scheffersomyces xylosifermentans]|uniref:uncharacterized protein n=1 Tax=Scheffersomyces xylosifermentans TaxID=1304137 RepID=UPI00315CCD16